VGDPEPTPTVARRLEEGVWQPRLLDFST